MKKVGPWSFSGKGISAIVLTAVLSSQCVKDTAEVQLDQVPPLVVAGLQECSSHILFGYTDKTSYYPDEKIKVFIQSYNNIPLCGLDVYDQQDKVVFRVAGSVSPQQVGQNPSANGFNLSRYVEVSIPSNVASGVYLIGKKIPVVIKTRAPVDLVVVYPVNTANAYSESGGYNLYSAVDRPTHVSYLRPIPLQADAVYCLKWFSTLNRNIGYITDKDLDSYESFSQSKILTIVGHSEYWTKKARRNFDRFVNSGNHALILSGNTMWWQVRYGGDDDTYMICHKYLYPDPDADPTERTINWYEPSLGYSIQKSIGVDFNNGGFGLEKDNGWNGFKIIASESPLLTGLGVKQGEIIYLPSREMDGAPLLPFSSDTYPKIDTAALNFYRTELIGYDLGTRFQKQTVCTFIVAQRTKSSGIIVNTATTDWCSFNGMGGESAGKIKAITANAIDILLSNQEVFSK